jgi:3-hydroxyacyl-CoA dehydrogenase
VIIARDFPAFIVNRILIPMINEAVYTLMEGLGSASDIDAAMKLGCNQPMGPQALADLIGLDVVLSIMETLQRGRATRSIDAVLCFALTCQRAGWGAGRGVVFTSTAEFVPSSSRSRAQILADSVGCGRGRSERAMRT